MYSFRNDYSEGAHPDVMAALQETNLQQTVGYGLDPYCRKAADHIKEEIRNREAQVHFIPGGTQTNLLAIAAFLKPYEAVICAQTGHINVHETGAIEASGHKVLYADSSDGKLTPELVAPILKVHTDEHMVKPAMVYISNSTETGTIYKKAELSALSEYCRTEGLLLYLDGARMGAALASEENDLALADIAACTDCFYIGGTKNGALFGEAMVIVRSELQGNFRFHIKQRGAMLAKGRLLGIQFLTLFEKGLYYSIAAHANQMAARLQDAIKKAGYPLLSDSCTNQVFPVFPNSLVEEIKKDYDFEVWEETDDTHTCIRFVTSWATEEEAVEAFTKFICKAGVSGEDE